MMQLPGALVCGMAFGFLLQKGRVLRYDRQIGAMLFRDMTIFKFMLSAIVAGMIGFYLLKDMGRLQLLYKPLVLGANITGGLIFGFGWGLLGYCPGTSLGALGEGRWDALWGIAGMVFGAGIFAEAYAALKGTVMSWGSYGPVTLASALGIGHWPAIVLATCGVLLLFRFFEKKGL